MKKLLMLLPVLFLFGCVLQTPMGDFSLKPDNDAFQNLSINIDASDIQDGQNTSTDGQGLDQQNQGQQDQGEQQNQDQTTTSEESGIVYLDPGDYTFIIEIDGHSNIYYDKVGVVVRPGESSDPADWSTLFTAGYPQKSPRDFVITSRVLLGERDLENWRSSVIEGHFERKTILLSILNEDLEPVDQIRFSEAWPSEYSVTVTSGAFEETVVIASESVQYEHVQ